MGRLLLLLLECSHIVLRDWRKLILEPLSLGLWCVTAKPGTSRSWLKRLWHLLLAKLIGILWCEWIPKRLCWLSKPGGLLGLGKSGGLRLSKPRRLRLLLKSRLLRVECGLLSREASLLELHDLLL